MKFAILICFLAFPVKFNNGAKLQTSSWMKNLNSNENVDRLGPTIFLSNVKDSYPGAQMKCFMFTQMFDNCNGIF